MKVSDHFNKLHATRHESYLTACGLDREHVRSTADASAVDCPDCLVWLTDIQRGVGSEIEAAIVKVKE